MADNRVPLGNGTIIESNDGAHSYRIIELIGKGGSSLVYSALERSGNDGRRVILKEVYPNSKCFNRGIEPEKPQKVCPCDDDAQQLYKNICEGLEREPFLGGQAADSIAFADFAFSTFSSKEDNYYSVSPQNRPGVSLCELLNTDRSCINLRGCTILFSKIVQVIADLHDRAKILHLDLNPGNIIVAATNDINELIARICTGNESCENGDVSIYVPFIIDFGCSLKNKGALSMSIDKSPISDYSAPELTSGCSEGISTATDVYSVCRCFESFWQKCNHEIEEKYPTVKATVEEIISKGTDAAKRRRYKNMVRLNQAFADLINLIDNNGVSKAALWEAARKDYQQKLTRTFRNIGVNDIVEQILPLGRPSSLLEVNARIGNNKETKITEFLTTNTDKNTLIYGEGGMGKTTSLVRLLHTVYKNGIGYDKDAPVPIYVQLNKAPDSVDALIKEGNSQSTFILRYIAKLLHNNVDYGEVNDEMLSKIRNELFKEHYGKDYLIILDGLNEVSTKWSKENQCSVQALIVREISYLIDVCKNAAFIITTRTDSADLKSIKADRIELVGVTDDTIYDFLKSVGMEDRIETVKNNTSLRQCLRTPLFLMMYTHILKDSAEISSQGEIMKAFWHEAAVYYTQRVAMDKEGARDITPDQCRFIFDFIVPELCLAMEQNEEMSISFGDAEKIVKRTVEEFTCDNELLQYRIRHYTDYPKVSTIDCVDISDVVNDLVGHRKSTRRILNEIQNAGLLYLAEDKSLNPLHQDYRDYFAAVAVAQRTRVAVEANCDNNKLAFDSLEFLRKRPLSDGVKRFLGEYLGEHHNTLDEDPVKRDIPTECCDRNLINRTIDIFRGHYGDAGYGLRNLFSVLRRVRNVDSKDDGLCGENFSNLDLTKCDFSGAVLSKDGCICNFDGAKLTENTLFFPGHTRPIDKVVFSHDGKELLSYAQDGKMKVWSLADGTCELTADNIFDLNNTICSDASTAVIERTIVRIDSKRNFSDTIRYLETFEHRRNREHTSEYCEIYNQSTDKLIASVNIPLSDHLLERLSIMQAIVFNAGNRLLWYNARFHGTDDDLSIFSSGIGFTVYDISNKKENNTVLQNKGCDSKEILYCVSVKPNSNLFAATFAARDYIETRIYNSDNGRIVFDSISAGIEGRIAECIHSNVEKFNPFASDDIDSLCSAYSMTIHCHYNADGKLLMLCSLGAVAVLDGETYETKSIIPIDTLNLVDAVFNEQAVIVVKADGTVERFDIDTAKSISRFNYGELLHYAFSFDGCKMAAVPKDHPSSIAVIETKHGSLLYEYIGTDVSINSIIADNESVVATSTNSRVSVWNETLLETGYMSENVEAVELYDDVIHVRTLSDGKSVFIERKTNGSSMSVPNLVSMWEYLNTIQNFEKFYRLSDGRVIGYRVNDTNISFRVIIDKRNEALAPCVIETPCRADVVFHEKDEIFILIYGRTVEIWNYIENRKLCTVTDEHDIRGVVLSPDLSRMITESCYSTDAKYSGCYVRFWDVSSSIGTVMPCIHRRYLSFPYFPYMYREKTLESTRFSPDGRYFSTYCAVYRSQDGLPLFSTGFDASMFSPNGMYFITCYESTINFYDLENLDIADEAILTDQFIIPELLRITPDSKNIVYGTTDGRVVVCDAKTGEVIHTYHQNYDLKIKGCDFSKLHDSPLSDSVREILQQYGAIV